MRKFFQLPNQHRYFCRSIKQLLLGGYGLPREKSDPHIKKLKCRHRAGTKHSFMALAFSSPCYFASPLTSTLRRFFSNMSSIDETMDGVTPKPICHLPRSRNSSSIHRSQHRVFHSHLSLDSVTSLSTRARERKSYEAPSDKWTLTINHFSNWRSQPWAQQCGRGQNLR